VESPDARHRTDPSKESYTNQIRKGEIQPARSGSSELFMQGGVSYEPDDFRTKVEDKWPDCDGVPGTGDEGDWGVFEVCGSPTNYGAQDGKLQYFEIDNKAALDDGEYFTGIPTNVGTSLDAEASVLRLGNQLVMAVNYGSRIYFLKSLDGQRGLEWDLDPILLDRPAVVPRQQRGGGSPNSPVVSSGPLGFCETAPQPGSDDAWAAPELAAWAQQVGVTATAGGGAFLNLPRGYPNVSAVTYGSNHHLESPALVDNYALDPVNGWTAITSGPDGIINTFFAPRKAAYEKKPGSITGKLWTDGSAWVIEGITSEPYFGPGNADNHAVYDPAGLSYGAAIGGYITPLAGASTLGSNESAFLLGGDLWNPDIFEANTTSPARIGRSRNAVSMTWPGTSTGAPRACRLI